MLYARFLQGFGYDDLVHQFDKRYIIFIDILKPKKYNFKISNNLDFRVSK